MSEIDRPFLRFGNPTLWGIGATLLILALAVWLSWQQTCANEVAGVKICQTKLAYLKTAPPNEVGDALAGVAGVLAFIWIIVTVALQAEELRAQREVLSLTRDEMEEQRKATQDMARSLAAQAAIFEDEKKQREMDAVAKVLDALLADLARKCELLNGVVTWEFYRHEDDFSGMSDDQFRALGGQPTESMKPFSSGLQADLDERVHQHAKSLMILYIAMLHEERHRRCCKKANIDFFEGLTDLIDQIHAQAKTASRGQQIRIAALNLESMKDHLSELQKLDLWLPKREGNDAP